MNFTSPLEILVSSFKLKLLRWKGGSTVKLWVVTNSIRSSLRALYAQLFWITLAPSVLPRLLAQNLPELLFQVMSLSLFPKDLMKGFYDQYNLHHPRDIAGSGFRPVSKIPDCCLPWEFGPCLSPNVTGHPLRPVKDLRLGKLLPYQLSNLVQAHQKAKKISLSIRDFFRTFW